jgi:hypothetical protein
MGAPPLAVLTSGLNQNMSGAASGNAGGSFTPDGHPKLLHCWPVKLLQAGRGDYAGSGVMASRAAASLSR